MMFATLAIFLIVALIISSIYGYLSIYRKKMLQQQQKSEHVQVNSNHKIETNAGGQHEVEDIKNPLVENQDKNLNANAANIDHDIKIFVDAPTASDSEKPIGLLETNFPEIEDDVSIDVLFPTPSPSTASKW